MQASDAFWTVGGVQSYEEALDATGLGADQLETLAASGSRIPGAVLLDIAKNVHQVIWGEFADYADREGPEPHVIIRAVDSSFYEISSDDPLLLDRLKLAFEPRPKT